MWYIKFRVFRMMHNEKVFMKKGEFGTRPPKTGAGLCSNVELLSKLHSIPSDGAKVDYYTAVQLLPSAHFFIDTMLVAAVFVRRCLSTCN
jgi:hypothetical protein